MKTQIPNKFYKNIYEIDYQELKNRGINTLFFDLDNTLIPYDVTPLTLEVLTLLKSLEKDFKILIITNNTFKRTRKAVGENYPFLAFAKKPLKFAYKKGLKILNAKPSETCVIGDQVITDIFGANRMGIYSILVNPIDYHSEGWATRFNRWRQRRALKKIKKLYPSEYQEKFGDFDAR